MGFSVEGLDQVIGNIDSVLRALDGPEAKAVFVRGAEVVRDAAKGIVEVYSGPSRPDVIPGELRDAIFATAGAEQLPDAIVGVDLEKVPYALDVEFGNDHTAPASFLRAARDSRASEVEDVIANGLRQVIEDAVR